MRQRAVLDQRYVVPERRLANLLGQKVAPFGHYNGCCVLPAIGKRDREFRRISNHHRCLGNVLKHAAPSQLPLQPTNAHLGRRISFSFFNLFTDFVLAHAQVAFKLLAFEEVVQRRPGSEHETAFPGELEKPRKEKGGERAKACVLALPYHGPVPGQDRQYKIGNKNCRDERLQHAEHALH